MNKNILFLTTNNILGSCIKEYLSEFTYNIDINITPVQSCYAIILDTPKEADLHTAHKQFPNALLVALVAKNSFLNPDHLPLKFIEKPFYLNSLKKILQTEKSNDILLLGDFKLYPSKRRLINTCNDNIDHLTEKEVDILTFLHNHPRHIFSKEELLQKIWRYSPDMTTHTLETHIYRLRQKLAPSLLIHKEGGYGLWI